jgi:hypothetical protein
MIPNAWVASDFCDFQNQISWPSAPGEGVLIASYAVDLSKGEATAIDYFDIPPDRKPSPVRLLSGLGEWIYRIGRQPV